MFYDGSPFFQIVLDLVVQQSGHRLRVGAAVTDHTVPRYCDHAQAHVVEHLSQAVIPVRVL